MKTVYICLPVTGDLKHDFKLARKYTRFALLCGTAPVVPHFFAACIDNNNPNEKEIVANAGLQLMDMCDEVWAVGNHKSRSMVLELDYAYRILKIPILHISDMYIDEYLASKGRR